MQILTRVDMVVIEDYYHITTLNENVIWMKRTHLLPSFFLNPKASFCISTFNVKLLMTFLNVHNEEK